MTAFPQLLYHYTNQTGLLGIVKTRELWASKIQYLNDTTEFLHGLNHITRVLQERERASSDPVLRSYLKTVQGSVERMSGLNVFVVSFSGSADLLSQWRAYSRNEIGYALGFEINRLANLASQQDFILEACIYEPSAQQSKAEEFVDHQLEYFASLRDRFATGDEDSVSKWTQKMTREFCQHASTLAPLFKDHAFGEEREWRLISRPKSVHDKAYGVRSTRTFLVPYYAFSLEKLEEFVIDEIIVGPSPEKDLIRSATCDLLGINRVLKWSVYNSRIPFRAP